MLPNKSLNKITSRKHFSSYDLNLSIKKFITIGNNRLKRYLPSSLSCSKLNDYALIGQFDKKFILFYNKKEKSIMILDQHAIHERILYETFLNTLHIKLTSTDKITETFINQYCIDKYQFLYKISIGSHKLKNPICIDIMKVNIEFDYQLIEGENSFFYFSSYYDKTKKELTITNTPIIYDYVFIEEDAIELYLNILMNFKEIFRKVRICHTDILSIINNTQFYTSIHDFIDVFSNKIKSKSCRNSIMFNDELDKEIMNEVFKQLKLCDNPFLCAHGRHNFFILNKVYR